MLTTVARLDQHSPDPVDSHFITKQAGHNRTFTRSPVEITHYRDLIWSYPFEIERIELSYALSSWNSTWLIYDHDGLPYLSYWSNLPLHLLCLRSNSEASYVTTIIVSFKGDKQIVTFFYVVYSIVYSQYTVFPVLSIFIWNYMRHFRYLLNVWYVYTDDAVLELV